VLASNIAEGNIAPERFRQSQLDLYSQSREANMQNILNDASRLDNIPVDVTKTTFPDQFSSTAADQLRKDTLGSMDSLLADTAPKATVDSLQEIVVTAKRVAEPKSLLTRTVDAGKEFISDIPENVVRGFEEAPARFREGIAEAPANIALGAVYDAIDPQPDPVFNQYAIASPNILGAVDSTSTGISLGQGADLLQNFNQNMAQGNLYGDAGFIFDYLSSMESLQALQQQGIDVGLGGPRAA